MADQTKQTSPRRGKRWELRRETIAIIGEHNGMPTFEIHAKSEFEEASEKRSDVSRLMSFGPAKWLLVKRHMKELLDYCSKVEAGEL